uniref:2-oxoglutarate dehydrogenase E1 component DHKTD1, mitochondrial n=1 Tax=Haemonchus placei TaxID=6290 RepID=A0A0N4WQN8_HAEPC
MSKLMDDIELVPIADVKLHLVRTYEARMKRRWERKQQKEETTIPLLQHGELFAKKLQSVEGYVIPDNWEEVHSTVLRQGTLLPALFLSSMKHYYPKHFLPAIEVIGERIWEQQLPVHKGAHLFQCSRDAGISFKESDEIISRLSHVGACFQISVNGCCAMVLSLFQHLFFRLPALHFLLQQQVTHRQQPSTISMISRNPR